MDLDVVNENKRTVKLFNRKVEFRNLTMEEHLQCEYKAKLIDNMPLATKKDIKETTQMVQDYILGVLDVSEDEVKQISVEQYRKLRRIVQRLELYEQGFSDNEISKIERQAIKKNLAQQ
jgi:hypothetical protein